MTNPSTFEWQVGGVDVFGDSAAGRVLHFNLPPHYGHPRQRETPTTFARRPLEIPATYDRAT